LAYVRISEHDGEQPHDVRHGQLPSAGGVVGAEGSSDLLLVVRIEDDRRRHSARVSGD
jgi:hypothetical protein